MDAKAFMELVANMREQQRRYFKAEYGSKEKQEALSLSKELERRVDAAIRDAADKQQRLI